MNDFYKGVDVSSLAELEAHGARYRDANGERDLLAILAAHGVNAVRLRLWNDPWSAEGESYGGGGNDLATTVALGQRVRALGMDLLLDLHYSDFWADPAKQHLPKAWRGLDDDRLAAAIHDFTANALTTLRASGAAPAMVQVGNEVTNGLLWPNGKRAASEAPPSPSGADAMARFLSAGIRAVRAAAPGTPVMLHLDQGGDHALYRAWLDEYLARGDDFEVIGLSYYPYWHGTLLALAQNLDGLARQYGKELVVVETAMGFTTDDYADREGLGPGERKGMATRPELVARVPYPMTPRGQAEFLRDLTAILRRVEGGHGRGFFYWEPAWLPVKGSGWSTAAGLRYLGVDAPGGNEWANQALFDYDGNALPALELFRDL
jgi:arabinogalactan endo-1,4-beta-galactosidase